MDLKEFTMNLETVEEYSEKLSPQAFYIAGFASDKIPLGKLLKYLSTIQQLYEKDKLNETNKGMLEFRLWQGQLAQTKEFLRKIPKQRPPEEFGEEVQELAKKTLALVHELTAEIEQERAQKKKALEEKRRRELAHKCKMCNDPVDEREYFPLETCGEILHAACIHESIVEQLNTKTIPKCPVCKRDIAMIDLRERLTEKEFTVYEELTLKHFTAENGLYSCPTPGCKYAFIWEDGAQHYECPICRKEYCLNCRTEYHKLLSCIENKETWQFRQINTGYRYEIANFVICPKCKFWNKKDKPFGRVVCKCNYEFCSECGEHNCNCR